MKFDLKSMTRKELEKLKGLVEKELEKASEKDKVAAVQAAEKAAAAHGFTLADLTGAKAPAKRGRKPGSTATKAKAKTPGVPKYRNPSNPSDTWTGKGRQPVWFKDAVAAGTSPASLAI
jgi:DNA-binding protein H-NS